MGWDGIFDVCDVEIVVFYVALFDEVVCYSGDVVAVVDIGKLVYLGQTLFTKGVYYKSAEIEKVVMSFWLASCHFLLSGIIALYVIAVSKIVVWIIIQRNS